MFTHILSIACFALQENPFSQLDKIYFIDVPNSPLKNIMSKALEASTGSRLRHNLRVHNIVYCLENKAHLHSFRKVQKCRKDRTALQGKQSSSLHFQPFPSPQQPKPKGNRAPTPLFFSAHGSFIDINTIKQDPVDVTSHRRLCATLIMS